MEGYSPKLPLKKDKIDGYATNKTVIDTIKQNFKMLLLTNPGERIMNPDYGVGLKQLLFSQNSANLSSSINLRIRDQIRKYMNFISVVDVTINTPSTNENRLDVYIQYQIPYLNSLEEINLSFDSN